MSTRRRPSGKFRWWYWNATDSLRFLNLWWLVQATLASVINLIQLICTSKPTITQTIRTKG